MNAEKPIKGFPAWYLLLSSLHLAGWKLISERFACSHSRPVPAPVHVPQRSLRQGTQKGILNCRVSVWTGNEVFKVQRKGI